MGGMGRPGGVRQGFGMTMLGSDPPDHTRLRTLVSHAFTPRRITALEPRIRQIAEDLLDEVAPDGAFDLMPAFAEPLPVTIIAEMLGIPVADRKEFKRWSDAIVSFGGGTRGEGDGRSAMEELTAYLRHQLDLRRSRPTDDLIGALMVAEEAGDRLSPEEALATCVLLLIAGNETTTNLIGNAVVALDEHELLPAVAADPGLIPGAVEETLRHQPPVLSIVRNTVREVTLGGATIPAGAFVFVVLAAANRDPAVFPEPERFDITRSPNRNIAFGHGIHFCLGAPLARLEARAGLEVLLRRCPNLRRADSGPVERLPQMILYGPKRLPVVC
jgi:cytochrome P450